MGGLIGIAGTYGPLPLGYYMQDYADIGNPGVAPGQEQTQLSGVARLLNPTVAAADWGQIEGTAVRGGYGGEDDLRVIWGDGDATGAVWANIGMDFGPQQADKFLAVRWLDGISNTGGLPDDSFEIFIDGNLLGAVRNGTPNHPERWYDLGVWDVGSLQGVHTVTLSATGAAAWPLFGTYGQVAFSEIATYTVPVPGAVLLGAIGLGLVGWVKRRMR